MVKKSTIIFAILAMLAFGICTCWGYTVTQWPAPGIPNTTFGPGSAGPIRRIRGYGGPGGYGDLAWMTADTAPGHRRILAVMARLPGTGWHR
jgi:hypothetical protein